MLPIELIAFIIAMIPVTAIIDYFAFRKRMMEINGGKPVSWHYFMMPCFTGGLLLGYYW